MLRKSLKMFIVMILLLGSLPLNFIESASAEGSHQVVVPIGYTPIYTVDDLNKVRNNLSGKYIVMNDIDLTEATRENGSFYNEGKGWIPIGTETTPFQGTFDGNGYKISGLNQQIKSELVIYAGLFGYVKNGKILNIGMENSSITAENTSLDSSTSKVYAGGIVGYGYNISVTDSYNTGSVSAQSLFDGYAGGIIGYVSGQYNTIATITNSYNTGIIQAKTNTGGIAGEVYRTAISGVYNTADLNKTQSKNTGGIVGYMYSNSSITDAYNTGNISYQSRGGGIVGYASSSSIKNVNNEGDLSSATSSSDGGGILGYGSTVTISNSFNNGNIISTANYSEGGGIAGTITSNSSISESYNNGNISVDSYASGIASTAYRSVINQVFNTGTVTATSSGGIVSYGSEITIIDSFNIGTIKGRYNLGGIAALALSGSSIKNTYNTGSLVSIVSYSSIDKGGIVGENEGTIENSYYIDLINTGVGIGAADGTYKVTFDHMKDKATFQGFDFTSIWKQDTESEFRFPLLSVVPTGESERIIDVSIASLPEKLQYIQGEELILTGGKLLVKTNHGNSKQVEMSQEMVSKINPDWTGNQTVKVTYDGFQTTFTVNVKPTYQVTFADYDGTILKTEDVVGGESATAPEVPIHDGRTFIGWDTTFSNVHDYLYVKAQYRVHEYSVTYRDGESSLFTQTHKYGETINIPEQPTKVGYAFLDWYTDSEYQNLYSFSEPIKSDVVLYAKFVKIPDKVQNIVVKPGIDYLKVTWKPVADADRYSVWWTTSPNEYFNGTYISPENNEYFISGLNQNQTYYVRVTANRLVDDKQIDSPDSQLISARTVFTGVTSPKATAVGADKVKLTWLKSPDATGYEIYRSESSGGSYYKIATTEGYKEDYLNTGLAPGKTYYYKIKAYREINGSTYYSPFSTITSAKPVLTGTTIKAAMAGYDKVKLTWTKSVEATGYEIYRADSLTSTFSKVITITNNSTLTYTNSGLATGKRYYYKIRVYKSIGGKNYYTGYSNSTYATPVLGGTNATAISSGYNKVKVSWKPVSGSHGYEVYRATSLSGSYSKVTTITKGSTLSYINTSLTTGRTYYYKVRAYRIVSGKKVYNSFSKVVSAKPTLAAPSKIYLTKGSKTAIKVSWYNAGEATGYEIYRSIQKTGTYSRIKSITSAKTTSYTNTSLARAKTYYYKVRAYKVVNGKKVYSSFTTVAIYKL
ncbi:InlB B-repeat-containing protein [Bacillus suaedaesalsae]|uniref:InlB B-repeat-containing protein n=1 Tax=Bacillus suaedaesalsae TaxID=2810349 RepID=A0ABS2DKW1_9BACI|nr:InlB B-repeat-containing protein [Bacillus suaedaesalsae]MBM6619109.1 InlB B-repeat-containing protein [Bacillus suaedaesalsae]